MIIWVNIPSLSNGQNSESNCNIILILQIVLKSNRSAHCMFKVREGGVTPINFPNNNGNKTTLIPDVDESEDTLNGDTGNDTPSLEKRSLNLRIPAILTFTMVLGTDRLYRRRLGSTYIEKTNKILNLVKGFLRLPSLIMSFDFMIVGWRELRHRIYNFAFRGL